MSDVKAVKPVKHTIDLGDGVEREIAFTLNAMADLESKFGTVEAAFEKMEQNNIAAIRYLFWCLLNTSNTEEITEREVGNLIDMRNLNDIMESVMDYMEEAMPAMQGMVSKNQEKPTQSW